jgi:thymidylate synthase (FAD)
MEIVKQSYEVMLWPAFDLVERAARTCYKSEGSMDPDTDGYEFTFKMLERKHMAMIEFAHMVVKFITDRGVSHELVRHRLCSFAQESTRYCNYKGGVVFIEPSTFEDWDQESRVVWLQSCERSEQRYVKLIELGRSPQQARAVLPNSTKTEIVVKANMREWLHIFQLRCAPSAHPDIQALMNPLRKELLAEFKWLKGFV